MKINWDLIDQDMFSEVRLSNCPPIIAIQAENILELLKRTEYPSYNKMTQFDKWLMVQYWRQFDGLQKDLSNGEFEAWFVNRATAPEFIRRARQWLIEHNYLIPSQGVGKRAKDAGRKWG